MNLSCIWGKINNDDRKDVVTLLHYYQFRYNDKQARNIIDEMFYNKSYERLIFFDIEMVHDILKRSMPSSRLWGINKKMFRLIVLMNKAITDEQGDYRQLIC